MMAVSVLNESLSISSISRILEIQRSTIYGRMNEKERKETRKPRIA